MGQAKSRQTKSKPARNQESANVDEPVGIGRGDNLTSKEDQKATKESNSEARDLDESRHTNTKTLQPKQEDQMPTANGTCAIDILTDDALLSIFSYLILLRDRGRVARTCQRWNRLMKEPALWQTVDFWTGGGFITEDHLATWQALQFPLDVNLALQVLTIYPKASLQHVYLRVANIKILRYLTTDCPNLKTLSFVSPLQDLPLFDEDAHNFFKNDNFVLPESLNKLQLSSEVMKRYENKFSSTRNMARGNVYIQMTNDVINTIIQYRNLRHISISNCKPLSEEQHDTLTLGLPNLQELWLLYLYDFERLGRPSNQLSVNFEESPRRIAHNLHSLTSLRFIPFNHGVRPAPPSNNIDDCLQELSQRRNLRELHIGDAEFTPHAFASMAGSLNSLEELVFVYCSSVTDEILEVIAKSVPGLKSLGLPLRLAQNHGTSWKNTMYTGRGFTALRNHPSLRSISFYRMRGDINEYDITFSTTAVTELFEMLMTLPKLRIVRGLGCFKYVARPVFEHYWTLLCAKKPHVQVRGSDYYCVYQGI